MKITYITNVRLPTPRAHGLQVMKSCEAFAANDVQVRLIVPALRRKPNKSPFAYYGVKQSFDVRRTFVLEVVPLVRWLGSWVSYVQNFSFSFVAVLYALVRGWLGDSFIIYTRDPMTALLLTFIGKRPVFELHDYRSAKPKSSLRRVLQCAKMILVNSEGTRVAVDRHYGIPRAKIHVIPNGVDPEYFDIATTRSEAREQLSLPGESLLIGYIGMLETVGKEKGVQTLLDAFRQIYSQRPDVTLLIVGGPDALARKYEQFALEQNISDRVVIPGRVGYEDIPLWFRALDVLILPSPKGVHATTTSPIKLFEYMAAGRGILAADLDSYRRLLGPEHARFYQAGDAQDLAREILWAAEHTQDMSALGEYARQEARNHTWGIRAGKIIQILHE